MITIKNITMKNFMSCGNVAQAISLENSDLTLVLGNNVDMGGSGSKNGVGKSTILNALSFALYGSALTNIKKDNMINLTNNKNMFVSLEFEKDKVKYKIERGRRPVTLKFYINDQNFDDDETNENQGENRLTQEEIENIIGMSHTMFKHLVCLNTFTEPFLSMRAADQRDAIEQLLGITQLSEKAATLKELIKETKDSIKEEEYKIKALENANEQINKSITDLKRRQRIWKEQNKKDVNDLVNAIDELNKIDIEQELINHTNLSNYLEKFELKKNLETKLETNTTNLNKLKIRKEKYEIEIEKLSNHECFACGQTLHDENHESMVLDKTTTLEEVCAEIKTVTESLEKIKAELDKIVLDSKPNTFYKNINEAYEHKSSISYIENQLNSKRNENDPYIEQITSLKETGVKEISWDKINELTTLNEHQSFLLKLLTNKDSFIRKKIIEQNLSYMNNRLEYYLEKMGLPHEVKFKSDLSVEITELGRDLDFDNLSRGERNRLILGLSWSFRDVFESMNHSINFMAVDELLDGGLDQVGVESSLEVLKSMVRDRNKSIFLISHREELIGRVDNILTVTKENGFTSFSYDE